MVFGRTEFYIHNFGLWTVERTSKDHYFYDPENPNDPRTNLYSKNSRLTLNQTNQATEASTLHLEKETS